jgi:hypothetical protein
MEVNFSQLSKALSPIVLTLLGIAIEGKLLHPEKLRYPILVTLLGIVMEVRLIHSEKT